MEKNHLDKIKRKRMNLRTKIRNYVAEGKDISKLQNDYIIILEELKNLGVKVKTKPTTKYLINDNVIVNDNVIAHDEVIVNQNTNQYIINLAWTNQIEMDIIYNMESYFDSIGLKKISHDVNSYGDENEHIIKYEFNGRDESFQILQKSSILILDILSNKNNNIAVYGKKITYTH